MFSNKINFHKEKSPTVEKEPLRLVFPYSGTISPYLGTIFPYLGTISLQTRTKLQRSIKVVLKVANCKLFLKFKINSNNFRFKDPIPQILTSRMIDILTENDRHLTVRSVEDIVISPLTKRRMQPGTDSAVCHNLLNCNYSPS